MADQKFAELLAMGYRSKYIERAIDVHKKSKYGTNWNLSILVEIIGRLQAKDVQFPLPQQPQVRLQQSDIYARKPYHSFLVDVDDDDDSKSISNDAENLNNDNSKATECELELESDRELEEEDILVPHYMNIQEPLALQVNDYIDYRYENGRYLLCKIIAKSQQLQNMMLLHPVGKPIYDTKYDRLVDIYQEYFKLSPAKSICLKKIKSKRHKLHSLRVNDYIDINPFCNGHKGWVNGKIIKLDANSSQVKVLYHNNNDNTKYSFWAHLQNRQEVAAFRSQCDNVDPHQINLVNHQINTKFKSIDNMIELQIKPQQKQPNVHQADDQHDEAEEKQPNDEQEQDEQGHGEDILSKHLDCSEIDDNGICAHLLQYDAFKWEFKSATVEIYRLQMNHINHTHMLPHPISIRFPQYFSSIAIPAAQTQFFANILPPKHGEIIKHISIKKWRVRIIIKETTTKELISKIVLKLQTSFDIKTSTFDYESSQFMLKIVGCHEYILYDENKLIIDYEAVRKAVRNEDNVKFQLLYCPNFKQIEKECFNTNMHHISKYKMKYFDAGLLTKQITAKHQQKILKYCPNACGDGEYDMLNDDKLLVNGDGDDVKEEADADPDPFGTIISDFAAQSFDAGHDEQILPNLASMKDVAHLLKTIDRRNNEIFLHEFDEFYCLKIMFLLNVTQFPLYKHYCKKHKGLKGKCKWRVLVRHELWIGSLRYDACTFDTDYKHGTSVGMRFNQSFCARLKYCDLARESCLSFTVYLCKINENKDKDIDAKIICYDQEIAIAFVRFPLIDDCNILRKGQYSLNLWPIPLFVSYYKGPKCDAFADLSFKYTGTTVDRYLKKFKDNKKKELQNVFKLGIEFKEYNNGETIIALPLNHRFDFKKSNYKSDNIAECDRLIAFDLLHQYNGEEKQIIWKHRDILSKNPAALTAFVRCIDFRDKYQRSELYAYVSKWKCNDKNLSDFLELLSYEFMDNYIRQYAVTKLAQMSDDDLQIYLLQLVQCLKYELHHNNALIRLLMRRCILNPNQIGHYFWWHIKSEYADNKQLNLMYVERFALYLEEYLLFSQTNIARNILIQTNLSMALNYINNKLRKYSKSYKGKNLNLLALLQRDLNKLNQVLPSDFILPIQPKWHCKHIIIEQCKIMSSAQMPLWLTFENVDCGQNTMMFKAGDDLRQDILTLNVIRVIDKIWLDRGLNLNLLFYAVICSGYGQGMVEIVLDSSTTTHIHTHYGGGPQKGARDITTHLKYLLDVNQNNLELVAKARDIYTRSCAGYCIASYVLGLGDRHPSNIMLRRKGELFHIDFSHFLGNFKSQKVIGDFVKWQREVAPFVFLPANKYCIENGNINVNNFKDDNNYQTFIQYNVNAYLSLRQKHKLLVNLFVLMLPSQMPELIIKKHINYLRDQLHLYDISNQNVYKHILKILDVCLSDKRRIMDNMIHAMVHQ